MGLFKKDPEKRRIKLQDKLDDARYQRETWGFAWSPSQKRKAEEYINELETQLANITN